MSTVCKRSRVLMPATQIPAVCVLIPEYVGSLGIRLAPTRRPTEKSFTEGNSGPGRVRVEAE